MNLLRKIKRSMAKQKPKYMASIATALALTFMAGQVSAMPTGGSVKLGAVDISDPANIIVSSNGVIHWDTFNVGTGEAVNFQFTPSASGIINRVVGGQLSTIAGTLSASGNPGATVLLVNPAGVVFNSGASINVPSMLVSTFDVDNNAFFNMLTTRGANITINKNSNNGTIAFNGNVSLVGNSNITALANAITVAPGVSITASPISGHDGGEGSIVLLAANSATFTSEVGMSGSVGSDGINYLDMVGTTTTQPGNTLQIGDATGGATLTAGQVTLLGNTVGINGSTASKSKITSLGIDQTDGIDIGAVNSTTNLANAIKFKATSDNKLTINNATVGLNDLSNTSTSARAFIVGGAIDINNSTFNYGHGVLSGGNGAYIMAGNEVTAAGGIAKGASPYDDFIYSSLAGNADNTNTINVKNTTFNTDNTPTYSNMHSRLALLGGKVDIQNTQAQVGEFFVGAGTDMALEAQKDALTDTTYYDEYFFGNGASSSGSTISLDASTTVKAGGESALYANAINNAADINVTDRWGIHLGAADSYQSSDNSYTINVSSGNTIVNSGTITVDAGDPALSPNGYVLITGNSLNNTGTIQLASGGTYTVVLADSLTGNNVQGGSGTFQQGRDDPKYNPQNPFNKITATATGPDTFSWSFSAGIVDPTKSLDQNKQDIIDEIHSSSNVNPGEIIRGIVGINGISPTDKRELVRTVVDNYTPTKEVMIRTDGEVNNHYTGWAEGVSGGVGRSTSPIAGEPQGAPSAVSITPAPQEDRNSTQPPSNHGTEDGEKIKAEN